MNRPPHEQGSPPPAPAPFIRPLSPEKRALLARRLRAVAPRPSQKPRLIRRPDPAAFPLSFAQERFWFLWCLEPDAPVYNMPLALRLRGALNAPALEQAWGEILRRHAVLRATFPVGDGQPTQVIRPWQPVTIPVTDLATLPAATRETELLRLARSAARLPFDLSEGPLYRASLLRLGPAENVLLLVIHHIAFDGWSGRILRDELAQLYEAIDKGQDSPLRPLGLDYADYAAWQRQCWDNGVWQADLDYWQEELHGPLPVVDLPIARPRPGTPRYHGASISCELDAAQANNMRAFCQREQVTPFMLLLAAYQVLLFRHSGAGDVIVGCPIAGRTDVGTESLVGCFINTLAVRSQLRSETSFRDFLVQVRDKALAAYQHQAVPFEKVIASVNPLRTASTPPVFQILFNFRNLPAPSPAPTAFPSEPWNFDRELALFDLVLTVAEHPGGISFEWTYDCDLFAEEDIRRLAECYRVLLCGAMADPAVCLGELPLMSAEERRRIVVDWNKTRRDYPRDKCVHQLFEDQVARTPEAVAVVFGDRDLTYAELNANANRLAHHLRKLDVGPEVLVGICLERSLDMVIAILGILKAGGAYVPVDPSHPAERLKHTLEDSAAPVIVTQQSLKGVIPAGTARLVSLDGDQDEIERAPTAAPEVRVEPANLAYVIYTSGSSGKPKGVLVTHESVVNCLGSARHRPGLSAQDSLLAVSTLAFDIATAEILLPLTVGARLIVASREEARDAGQLRRRLVHARPTVLHATPATWQMLLDSGWEGDRRLQAWCGGEALSRQLADRLLPITGSLWNLYGPTETTIYATVEEVVPAFEPVGIGRPIANTRCYVLDAGAQLAPIGMPGELYIGGDGLARGYLNRPQQTAERFVSSPFEPQERIYRTGDRVRWRADGSLEFLGRLDDQVKLRGFRIELGEIEAALRQFPGVTQSVVLLREDHPGDPRLVGYYIPSDQRALAHADLTRHLREKLPDYMVPSAYVPLARLPLTPNGKVDRRALPAPGRDRPDLATGYVAPRNALEAQLAAIWVEVLGAERVGVHDNFFELGGHSLSATRIVSKLRGVLHVEMPLRTVFETPTIAGLAESIHGAPGNPHAGSGRASQPDERGLADLDYWRKRLTGLDPLPLATDWPRPARPSHQIAQHALRVDSQLVQRLRQQSDTAGATLPMTLLAVLQVLLYRSTGHGDVAVGVPSVGRSRLEPQPLIGGSVNTLVIRSELSAESTFRQLLARVRETYLAAYDHRELPFERLVEELLPKRDWARTPWFRVFLDAVSLDSLEPELLGPTTEAIEVLAPNSNVDVTLLARDRRGDVELLWVYKPDLFQAVTIQHLAAQYKQLLSQIVLAPDQRIGSYSLVTPESRAVIADPALPIESPRAEVVTDLFFELARRRPELLAVRQDASGWSYGYLADQVRAVSAALAADIRPGEVVAVEGNKCFGLVVGMLGVLASGGVLLPLDPRLPRERKANMLRQARAMRLLHTGLRPQDRWWRDASLPLLDAEIDPAEGRLLLRRPPENGASQQPRLSGDDPAYIFFTSGTTGAPKGILGLHKGLSHFVTWQRDQFAISPEDRVAQLTSISFDMMLRDFFMPLVSGACVSLPNPEMPAASPRTLDWLSQEHISIVHVVPSIVRTWLEPRKEPVSLRALRYVFFGGEPLTRTLVGRWRQICGTQGKLVNFYGPTETTMVKCYYEVPADCFWDIAPIGRPLPQTQVLLLNEQGQQCGIGESGEIVIRTPFCAQGYLSDADKQRGAFRQNPLRDDPADRWYHTGDLGLCRADGTLEIKGRLDDQVKIRGVRVEPREVEAVLEQHPAVSAACVAVTDRGPGDARLVAYVEARAAVGDDELFSYLMDRLPAAMIPAALVRLDSLPLSANGKVDRSALLAPEHWRREHAAGYVAPRGMLQEQLAAIWEDVLTRKQIGVHDNFFDLGGHSVLATQLVSRVRQNFDVELPLQAVFMNPTIERMALHLLEHQTVTADNEEVESLLDELEGMAEDEAEAELLKLAGDVDRAVVANEETPGQAEVPDFHCPRTPSPWFGKRKCNLVIVHNEHFEADSFEQVACYVLELDPCIDVAVVRDSPSTRLELEPRPTLVFSPAMLRYPPPLQARVFCGLPLSKSEEYTALEKAGIVVPKWIILGEGDTPDLSSFDNFVVRKPDYGGLGAAVLIVRKTRVRWKAITTSKMGTSSRMLIQKFVYTGPRPVSYRVNTLFGKVLYAVRHEASADRPELGGPDDFGSIVSQPGMSIVASARGSQVRPCYDADIIRLGESAHAAFPEIPLLGIDIVREVPSEKLYALEANAIGYVWNFRSDQPASYGFSFEEQFDGVRKSAYLLAEKTQECAR